MLTFSSFNHLVTIKLWSVKIFGKQTSSVPYWDVQLYFCVSLFASYLPQLSGLDENDYLITTDTDLWPLKRSMVHMPDNYDLLLAHSHCCSDFEHLNGKFYRMLPISYIGARLSTWRQIMKCSHLSFDSKTILDILQSEFGSSVMNRTSEIIDKYSDEW